MTTNHYEMEKQLTAAYRSTAASYRKNDEVHVTGKDHQRQCEILAILSNSFTHPIAALDAGCGTGRYFHCLKNTRKLIGLDISPEMIEEARHPVREDQVSTLEIELICGNVHTTSFAANSVELIYSIGVFGNGCPVTPAVLSKLFTWLSPGGRLFFDVFDVSGLPEPLKKTKLRRIFVKVCPRPILSLFRRSRNSLPLHTYSRDQIISMLESSGFLALAVYPQECQMPLGLGHKLQCFAVKPDHLQSRCCKAA